MSGSRPSLVNTGPGTAWSRCVRKISGSGKCIHTQLLRSCSRRPIQSRTSLGLARSILETRGFYRSGQLDFASWANRDRETVAKAAQMLAAKMETNENGAHQSRVSPFDLT